MNFLEAKNAPTHSISMIAISFNGRWELDNQLPFKRPKLGLVYRNELYFPLGLIIVIYILFHTTV